MMTTIKFMDDHACYSNLFLHQSSLYVSISYPYINSQPHCSTSLLTSFSTLLSYLFPPHSSTSFLHLISLGAMAYVAIFELLTEAIEDCSLLVSGIIGTVSCGAMIVTQELVKGSIQ